MLPYYYLDNQIKAVYKTGAQAGLAGYTRVYFYAVGYYVTGYYLRYEAGASYYYKNYVAGYSTMDITII